MLKAKKLKDFLNKRFREVRQHLKTFCLNHNSEELHQLRVSIKKIYALVHLQKSCSKNPAFSLPVKKVKKVFKHAGRIRTAEINLQLLVNYSIHDATYNTEQKDIVNHESQLFCAAEKQYQQEVKKNKNKMVKRIVAIPGKAFWFFFQKEMQQLADFFSVPIKGEALHAIRKKIKDLIYIQAVLPKSMLKKSKPTTKYLDKLQEAIGLWHDSTIALQLLKNNALTDIVITDKLNEQANKQLENVISLSQNFVHKTGYAFAS